MRRTTADERAERADIADSVGTLLEALPYIRQFHGRTVVIKYGGAAMEEEILRDEFATDIVLLKYVGLNPVIVHGGGPEITRYMKKLGMEVKFVEGLRVSDRETVEVAKMVLLGKINSDIVQRLNRAGQPAVGLSGEDGTLFHIKPAPEAEKVGFVGDIERVDVDVLNHIASDYIPVIASAGTDGEGNSYNVNADSAAGKVAAALKAYKAIFLTDVEGWRADADDPASLISQATRRGGRLGDPDARRRHAAEARRLRRGDPRRRRRRPHHRRPPPAQPAARALHRRRHRHQGDAVSGIEELRGARVPLRDADLRPQPGRVRARRGLADVGLRRQGVHRPVQRPLGPQRRPPAPGDRRRDRRPARPDRGLLQPLLLGAGAAPAGAALRSRASAAAASSATRAPRRTSPRSSSSASTPTPAASTRPRSSCSRTASTGARWRRSRRP